MHLHADPCMHAASVLEPHIRGLTNVVHVCTNAVHYVVVCVTESPRCHHQTVAMEHWKF